MLKEYRFPYEWNLKDAIFTKDKGKVFSCFACGGGSTMGYKLAGFDVIGCNEIDPRMMRVYIANHKPKFPFLESIQTFKLRDDLPPELYNLDILDGSPPCSSFSMAGNRDKDWGKEKKFREGQVDQILDNLFFDFIDLVKKLQPKIVVAENVKGLILGKAKDYVIRIYKAFQDAGYELQIHPHLLVASDMGVPQKRERVFFIAVRKDLAGSYMEQVDMFQRAPKLKLDFKEEPITFGEMKDPVGNDKGITDYIIERMAQRIPSDKSIGDINERLYNKVSMFNQMILKDAEVMPTIISGATMYRDCDVKTATDGDYKKGGSYPMDYDFCGNPVQYIIGMSVPPVMLANIATEIYNQWKPIFTNEDDSIR